MIKSKKLSLVPCVLLVSTVLLVGCEALATAAWRFGGSLLSSAVTNYTPNYGAEVKSLLVDLKGEIMSGKSNSLIVPAAHGPSDTGSPRPPIALDVALLRQQDVDGGVESTPIGDGEILVDTREDGTSDRFKIYFKADRPCWVYVILVDGTGWVQPLFPGPASGQINPIRPATENFLPEGELAFGLDSYKGVETVYFVASHTPRPDLEATMRRFAVKTRTPPSDPEFVDEPAVLSRGVSGSAPGEPGRLKTRSGVVPFETTRFLSKLGEDSLVITRWFRHQ